MSFKKGHAFLSGLVFMTLFTIGAWMLDGAYIALGGAILTAVVAMVGLFFGGNVADNINKSVNYRPELSETAKVDRDQP